MKLQSKHTYIGIKSFFISLFASVLIFSCSKPPEFSEVPEISFDTIVKSVSLDPDLLTEVSNITVTIKFQDGDGDLGVLTSDINNSDYSAYADTAEVDGVTVFTFRNYYLEFFRKNGNEYSLIETPISYNGSFEPLIGYDEIGPIEGSLSFDLLLVEVSALTGGFVKNDTVRCDVYIVDRALNESNKVSSTDIVLFNEE